jgi:hypothetical protein
VNVISWNIQIDLGNANDAKSVSPMPSITIDLSDKELIALREYANQCGETLSELVRKALIREATLADGYGADDPQYEYQMEVPTTSLRSEEHVIIQENYNRIRKILGWREIRI